jgi:hypothetical protein
MYGVGGNEEVKTEVGEMEVKYGVLRRVGWMTLHEMSGRGSRFQPPHLQDQFFCHNLIDPRKKILYAHWGLDIRAKRMKTNSRNGRLKSIVISKRLEVANF